MKAAGNEVESSSARWKFVLLVMVMNLPVASQDARPRRAKPVARWPSP